MQCSQRLRITRVASGRKSHFAYKAYKVVLARHRHEVEERHSIGLELPSKVGYSAAGIPSRFQKASSMPFLVPPRCRLKGS